MGSGYYGIPGYNPDFEQDNDSYYEYEPILSERDKPVEVQEPPISPGAALVIFLLGLPFLPVWSGLMILNAIFKIGWFADKEPAKSEMWKRNLHFYQIFFVIGVIMYMILYSIIRRFMYIVP